MDRIEASKQERPETASPLEQVLSGVALTMGIVLALGWIPISFYLIARERHAPRQETLALVGIARPTALMLLIAALASGLSHPVYIVFGLGIYALVTRRCWKQITDL